MKTVTRKLLLLAMLSLPLAGWSQTSIDYDNDGYDATVDCDDYNDQIYPGATEYCNGIDDNCDGNIDDGVTFQFFFADADGDGYGDASVSTEACSPPSGYVSDATDCDDLDNTVYPGATEVCNNIDDDCDGSIDNVISPPTFYEDADGDGYGNPASTVQDCVMPFGYVTSSTDCDDQNSSINPGADEICNSIDDDCNGVTDDGLSIAVSPVSGPGDQCVPMTYGYSTWSVPAVPGATSYTWTYPSNMQVLQGQGTNTFTGYWTTTAAHSGVKGLVCVTASNGCVSATSCKDVNIQIYIPGRPGSIFGPGKICPGETVLYYVNPVPKTTSYGWTFPAGMTIISGAGTNTVNVLVDNAYTGGTISVVAINGCGTSAIRTKVIARNTPASPGVITGPSSGLCGATGVAYTTAGSITATSYAWTLPGGATIASGAGTNSITVDYTGAIAGGNIAVSSVNGCGTSAARTYKVSLIAAIPSAVIGPLVNCPGSVQTYSVAPVAGATGYTWVNPQSATIQGGQGTSSLLLKWGNTELSGMAIKVKSDNACGSSSLKTSSGYSTSFAVCPPRLANAEKNGFSVYPNPASGSTAVELYVEHAGTAVITLTDATGRRIMVTDASLTEGQNKIQLSIADLQHGLYQVMVQTEENVFTSGLIIE
ncbi:MAG: MopE-related protein [Bacteroidia bacterium]